jgi:undecaprenyl-diphosphatase
MTWWAGLVLGLVQGLTEYLPVSSSGHLVLVEALLGVTVPGVVVEVSLHVATLLAVVWVYRARIVELLRGALGRDRAARRYLLLLLIATIPAGVAGVLLEDYFARTFHSMASLGIQFLLTGAILWSTRKPRPAPAAPEPGVAAALGIGVAQAVSILPAISRSGATVAAGLWAGMDPVRAGEFSFLMSVPVIAGAALLEVPKLSHAAVSVGTGPLLLSFVAAMVSGVFAIRWLVVLLRRGAFYRFAPYCWAVGLFSIVWALRS